MEEKLECGEKVLVGNQNGVITAVLNRFNNTTYEVSYFFGGEYKNVWLNRCEFSLSVTTQIGLAARE